MTHEQSPVRPVDPVAPWLGGKSRLADTIIAWINGVDHACYAEPFCGMGGIFLRRTQRPKAEVINDYSRDVSTFFRILQRHYVCFIEMIRWQLSTRADFERLVDMDPALLTDLERAARFLYILKTGFGGRITSRSFGVDTTGSGRFDITTLVPELERLHTRLSGVTIECLGYGEFIERYDRPHTLFYLDPPYWGCENDYGKNLFARDDFQKLADQLAGIKGKFILSLNDTPGVREVFAGFPIESVKTKYTIARDGGAQEALEVLIHNLQAVPRLQPDLF